MPLEVCTISGFDKTEGNSVAVKVDDEVVILDMGLGMESYIKYQEDREDVKSEKDYNDLVKLGAVPNYQYITDWMKQVVAIAPSHGHLDHIGAIPFSAQFFPQAPIVSTPYSIEVLKSILSEEHITLKNQLISVNLNASYTVSKNITLEFIHTTHSIPHTAMICVHTPYGKILYANDYKFDLQPIIGKKPNFSRLEQLGKEGILLLIVNCLYAHERKKTPSEFVARQMLKDVLLGVKATDKALFVTTFSSHIARLKSIIELGKQLHRTIVVLGRSLEKYILAAEKQNLVQFTPEIKLLRSREKMERMLRQIQKNKGNYLAICTGHQGEPRSVLSRLARRELDFQFTGGDVVIFSCHVIPVQVNIANRERLEQELWKTGARIFKDVHVSGHGALEDHRDLLQLVKPQHIIPIHAENAKAEMLKEFAAQLGFPNTQVMQDGKRMTFYRE